MHGILLVALGLLPAVIGVPQRAPGTHGSPAADTLPGGDLSWLVLPSLFHTPETGLGGGVVLGLYPDADRPGRSSSVLASLTYTSRSQVIIELLPELYLHEGRTRLYGELRGLRFPDVFYGVGAGTAAEAEEPFTGRILQLSADVERRVGDGLWLGGELVAREDVLLRVEEGGLLDRRGIPGSDGSRAIGVGAVVRLDTRDRAFGPSRGSLVELRATGFSTVLGGRSDFARLLLDARGYRPVRTGTLAGRAYLEAAPGDVPFQLMPRVGGARLLRGYREGRFRDAALVAVELELRFPILWRVGGVVFGGLGDVGPTPWELEPLGELERAVGAGVRVRVNDAGVNVRLDYARGREDGALYISIGEAF